MIKVSFKKKLSLLMIMAMVVSFVFAGIVPVNAVNPSCTINWNTTYQTIDGFGAMGGSWSNTSFLHNMKEPQRSQVLDMLYDQTSGMGLSVYRDDLVNTFEHDPNVYDYGDGENSRWMWGQAKARGCNMFFNSVFSQPAWMKIGNNINAGSVDSTKYQAYADYLVKYVKDYKTLYNIDVNGISIQNEPDYTANWIPTTSWTGTQFHDFIGGYLKPTFNSTSWTPASRPLVIIPEPMNPTGSNLADATLNDAATSDGMDIMAVHGYGITRDGNGIDYVNSSYFQNALNKGKKVWQSEVNGQNVYDESIGTAVKWAKSIYLYMTIAQASM